MRTYTVSLDALPAFLDDLARRGIVRDVTRDFVRWQATVETPEPSLRNLRIAEMAARDNEEDNYD